MLDWTLYRCVRGYVAQGSHEKTWRNPLRSRCKDVAPERQARLRPVPQVKVMRRALHLTQEEFASRFRIPLGTLRDWEQGKSEPDQAACAYLTVIARDPEAVRRALDAAPRP